MRVIRHIAQEVFVVGVLVVAGSLFFLLNFAAPNPTGRRYSSQVVPITGTSQEVGATAEAILSVDLKVPKNNSQCICEVGENANNLSGCSACLVYSPIQNKNSRKPDFVADGFLAESKNTEDLLYSEKAIASQIEDYVNAAITLKKPLFVYTRVNTELDGEFMRIVKTTGGAVVPYFAVPGWTDITDQRARCGLLIGGGMIGGSLLFLVLFGTGRKREAAQKVPVTPKDPLNKAIDRVEDTQEFGDKARNQTRDKLD